MEHQDGTTTKTVVTTVGEGQYAAQVWLALGEPVEINRLDDLNGVWEVKRGPERVGLYATKTKALEAVEALAAREWLA
jgi:hypothetical protein